MSKRNKVSLETSVSLLVANMSPDTLALARRDHPELFRGKTAGEKPTKPVRPANAWKNEDEFTKAVFDHVHGYMLVEWPELALAHHVANENAHRRPGVVGGVPDICIPVARGKYKGCYIELKVKDGKVSQRQSDVIYQLRIEGHFVLVVWDDLDLVLETIKLYMKGEAK